MTGDIKEKLKNSASFLSLQIEDRVRQILVSKGWSATQGAYYLDGKDGKLREMDVVGRQRWERKKDQTFADLFVPVECKSMTGFHLIFARTERRSLQFQVTGLCSWAGYVTGKVREAITSALHDFEYGKKDLHKLFATIEKVGYPSPDYRVRVWDLILDPFPERWSATAFKETNVSTEKDTENSVLWRAIQAVNSTVHSMQTKATDDFVSGLHSALWSEYINGDRGYVDYEIVRETSSVELYHPVVITTAQLWIGSNGHLESIPWCRFYQADVRGEVFKWCDVVNIEAAESYFSQLIHHYEKQAAKVSLSTVAARFSSS